MIRRNPRERDPRRGHRPRRKTKDRDWKLVELAKMRRLTTCSVRKHETCDSLLLTPSLFSQVQRGHEGLWWGSQRWPNWGEWDLWGLSRRQGDSTPDRRWEYRLGTILRGPLQDLSRVPTSPSTLLKLWNTSDPAGSQRPETTSCKSSHVNPELQQNTNNPANVSFTCEDFMLNWSQIIHFFCRSLTFWSKQHTTYNIF